jgi:uncharacterized membrane protein YjjP (DUF1212 family)
MKDELSESVVGETPSLEPIAMAALDAGRLLMESGASAASVEQIVITVARGLGADRADLRVGYASLALTIGIGQAGITRMRKVGHLGVNERMDQALRQLAARVSRGGLTVAETRAALDHLPGQIPRHSALVTAVAVGLACAAFGKLLKVDWLGIAPVFIASTLGQLIRRELTARHVNAFINATLVAFLCAVLSGLGARLAGSQTVPTAMIASILLLVPGVPSLNAQNDILDGRPTLGSARAVWVTIILVFVTAGLWLAQLILQEGH